MTIRQRRKPQRLLEPLELTPREECLARAHGRCEALVAKECTGAGEHAHHVQLRSRGGADTADNLLAVCEPCHTWVHAHPEAATRMGLMRSQHQPTT